MNFDQAQFELFFPDLSINQSLWVAIFMEHSRLSAAPGIADIHFQFIRTFPKVFLHFHQFHRILLPGFSANYITGCVQSTTKTNRNTSNSSIIHLASSQEIKLREIDYRALWESFSYCPKR